ncbi:MAG: hypothetical protein BWY45_02805 [Euryarchaeota archaeon ADurb.Bin294]|nr:MAG: hypothetical protein BWY45_02805 [Euryarchaeota archaeon ADurb.Bin294]
MRVWMIGSANTGNLYKHLDINPTHDAYPDIITG